MVRIRIEQIEKYAKDNNIPIMEKDGIMFLTNYIKENKIKNILEIGSAIGYSAIKMAMVEDNIKVITIERDINRYNEAVKNINDFELNKQINILLSDAFEVNIDDKFDLIFIDAAKSQYIKFFEKFKYNLKDRGVIISDNLNFHGLVHLKDDIASRSLRGIVRKLNAYLEFLEKNEEFETIFYNIGDGIGVSKKKHNV